MLLVAIAGSSPRQTLDASYTELPWSKLLFRPSMCSHDGLESSLLLFDALSTNATTAPTSRSALQLSKLLLHGPWNKNLQRTSLTGTAHVPVSNSRHNRLRGGHEAQCLRCHAGSHRVFTTCRHLASSHVRQGSQLPKSRPWISEVLAVMVIATQ